MRNRDKDIEQPEKQVDKDQQDHGASTQKQIGDLLERIQESTEKLRLDNTSRGDLKILSRAMRELRYAFKVFSPYREHRIITVFGSARTLPDNPAYTQAIDFGQRMAAEEWYVLTGAASGIMEAGHRGAGRKQSMGLNIMLPFEQDSNPIIRGDHKLVHMKYFFTRKLMFVKECDAVCLFPGGFGTLDEGLEVLTLLQTGKRDLVPVVFLDSPGASFWKDWDTFVRNRLLEEGMISPDDLSLYRLTDSVDVAVQEILDFYRIYHSMRFVKNKLVLRLNQHLSEETVQQLNDEFRDILASGTFEQCGTLDEEKDEPDLYDHPRLAFHFNRRSLGRLRQLIDKLNQQPVTT